MSSVYMIHHFSAYHLSLNSEKSSVSLEAQFEFVIKTVESLSLKKQVCLFVVEV